MGALTPSRRELLMAAAGSLVPGIGMSRSGPTGEAKHLIVVFVEGGWDVTFCLDPKLSCSAGGACSVEGPEVDQDPLDPLDREAVETFGGLPVVVNERKRPAVRSFFSRWHERIHVVNGIWTGSIAHDPCRYRILTGTPDGTRPDLVSITGSVHGAGLPLGAVDLSGWGIAGSLAASTGRIGTQSQIAALLDDTKPFQAPASGVPYPLFRASAADADATEAYLRQRTLALRARRADGAANDRAIDDLLQARERATRFRQQGRSILGALAVGQRARFAQQAQMAVDLIDAGMCHSVTLDTTEDWDTHESNALQHLYWDDLCHELGSLMQQLEERQLLDRVVVAVLSEMTRTPLRNSAGGKDHWGHTSALLMGAVAGDRVSGGTDHLLESLPVDLQTGELASAGALNKYDNLAAGVLELVGIDPGPWLLGVEPFRGAHVD